MLVVSFDGYSDLWPIFFRRFRDHWRECPYRIHLVTNNRTYEDASVVSLRVGPDRSWSEALSVALQRLDTPYVLVMQDDYLLEEPVDTQEVRRCLELLHRHKGSSIRLTRPVGSTTRRDRDSGLVQLSLDSPYRVAMQAAIWKVSDLESLLVPDETPWDMEIFGSERSRVMAHKYLVSPRPVVSYHPHGALIRGKWRRTAWREAQRGGEVSSSRGVLTMRESALHAFQSGIWNIGMRSVPRLIWRRSMRRHVLARSTTAP